MLFFFPKAFTPGCTREAGTFRDACAEMQELDEEGLVRGVYRHELRMGAHVDDALAALKRLGPLKR